jgi:hypothetical protein
MGAADGVAHPASGASNRAVSKSATQRRKWARGLRAVPSIGVRVGFWHVGSSRNRPMLAQRLADVEVKDARSVGIANESRWGLVSRGRTLRQLPRHRPDRLGDRLDRAQVALTLGGVTQHLVGFVEDFADQCQVVHQIAGCRHGSLGRELPA